MDKKEIYRHIELLLKATVRMESKKKVEIFMALSFLLGITISLSILKMVSITWIIMVFFIGLIAPYVVLRSKLQVDRVGNSREGEILINEILTNYKICYYNMTETIEKTAKTIEDAKYSRVLLFNLALGLNTAASKEDIESMLREFRYSINTTWADILATNIYFAVVEEAKVTTSLQDLAKSLTKSRKLIEYNSRGTNEARVMLKYLGPACMALTVIGAIKFFNFSIKKFLLYQFGTEEGLSWFLLIVLFYMIGIIVNIFLGNRKMDL